LQISSVFGIVPMDINNDGNLDFISHGNWYEMEIETNIQDASIGNVMLGNGDGTFTSMPARLSGFLSAGNTKGLSVITTGNLNIPAIITTNSSGAVQAFKFTPANKIIKLNANDRYAEIALKNGGTRRMEFYSGAGYLSQSSKIIVVTDDMQSISVIDNKGTQRNVFNNTGLLTAK
ncbi:MAG TPA: hypothetical protein VFM99_03910, partial [Chitinophagales bacterium]|nr:hypothetical protein [Chitinophagales bacterium]